jgi:hypothetical protein
MILRLLKFSPVAAVLVGLASSATPAAADGCGYYGCETAPPVAAAPPAVYVYPPAYSYVPVYPTAYAYVPTYYRYGYRRYGYAGYRAALAPYGYVNRFYHPRAFAGARGRGWRR